MELSAKTVNDLKPLKTLSQNDPPWVFDRVQRTSLVWLSHIYERGGKVIEVDQLCMNGFYLLLVF